MKYSLAELQNRPRVIKTDTRQWSSGRVRFSVMVIPGYAEKSYIIFEKDFFGNSSQRPQKFLLRLHDWENLKRLIEGGSRKEGLSQIAQWPVNITEDQVRKTIAEKPELIEIILNSPNLGNFSEVSLESLDKLALKIFEVKKGNIDLIFQRLAESSTTTIESFSNLLSDLRLGQVSLLSSLVYQKLKILDLLEKVTADPKTKEVIVHRLLESNPWILGKGFEIIQSDKSLFDYLGINVSIDPFTRKRPDLIVKRVPHSEEIVIVELKAPGVKLSAEHIGQVLTYRALIERYKPNTKRIHCFIFGYEEASTLTSSNDVVIRTFSELVANLRDEYEEYLKVLEIGKDEGLQIEEESLF